MILDYDKLFGWFKRQVAGRQVALVEKGERRKRLSERQRRLWESLGMKCDWYYYPNEISDFDFAMECKDLEPHYDDIYVQNGIWHSGFADCVDLKNKRVLIIGDGPNVEKLGYELIGKCRELIMTGAEAWQYIPLADVIFTAKRLNCYAIHNAAVIEIGDESCINVKNREVYGRLGEKPLWDLPFWILNKEKKIWQEKEIL